MPIPSLSPNELPATPEARAEFIKNAVKANDRDRLQALFAAELQAVPAFQADMAAYRPQGVDQFVDTYTEIKAKIYLEGPAALQGQADTFLKFREAAAKRLWHIQQKKLFDLQCQWRAGQIDLPGVRVSWDFQTWEHYLDYCPFLPPLTADEVARYEAYLRSDYFDYNENSGLWQSYRDFKLSEDPDRRAESHNDLPAWYAYHNVVTGAGALLSLPDVRGEWEERYLRLYRAERDAKRAATQSEAEKLPWPPECYGLGAIAPFLDLYEAAAELPRLHRWREAIRQKKALKSVELEQTEYWYYCILPEAGAWPIKAHPDWRVALRQAGIDYWRTHVADALHEVWQEQEQNRALGLPVLQSERGRTPFEELDWDDDWYIQAVLRGRELAGEPRTLDF